jgi:pimeloyl-ACP methyl ester carboxylesterase
MNGTLVRYGPKPANVAFISQVENKNRHFFVAVGGLSCGFMFAEYLKPLCSKLDRIGWTLVQPLLTSSHDGWGTGSVGEDSEELHSLLMMLRDTYGMQKAVLLGHSTGCQDAVMCARRFGKELNGIILQGPVSDREYLMGAFPNTAERIDLCRKMVEDGREDEIAFRFTEFGGTPITAKRWLSLADCSAAGGEDDMFSSDFSDERLQRELEALRDMPTLVMMSGADECQVPFGVDPEAIGKRLVDAMAPSARLAVIEGGVHDLKDHAEEASDVIIRFMDSLDADKKETT